jgi:hypothetical protein
MEAGLKVQLTITKLGTNFDKELRDWQKKPFKKWGASSVG